MKYRGHKGCVCCSRETALKTFGTVDTLAAVVVRLESEVRELRERNHELSVNCQTLELSCGLSAQSLASTKLAAKVSTLEAYLHDNVLQKR